MSELLYYLANAIIAYALLLVLWTALKRPTSIRYAFANMFRQRRRSGITLLAIIMGGVAVFIFGGFGLPSLPPHPINAVANSSGNNT